MNKRNYKEELNKMVMAVSIPYAFGVSIQMIPALMSEEDDSILLGTLCSLALTIGLAIFLIIFNKKNKYSNLGIYEQDILFIPVSDNIDDNILLLDTTCRISTYNKISHVRIYHNGIEYDCGYDSSAMDNLKHILDEQLKGSVILKPHKKL